MRAELKKLWVALVVMLLASIGLALPYPVLTPLFIDAASTPLNSWQGIKPEYLYTAILAIYPLGIFIGSSFIGALSDYYGRKNVLVKTLWICAIGYVVSTYALMTDDYLLLLLSRFFTGITEGNVAIARAIALDFGDEGDEEHREQDKTKAVSLINSAMFMGWLLGPLIGGVLAHFQPYYAFVAASLGALLAIFLVTVWLKESVVSDREEMNSIWHAVKQNNSLRIIGTGWYSQLFIMYLIYTLAVNLFYEFYPVWLVAEQSFNSLNIGLSTTNMTIFMTLTSLFMVSRIQIKFGLIKPIAFVMLMQALAMMIIPFTDALTTQIVFAVSGILIAIINGLLPVYVSQRATEHGNGAVMGLLTMTFCLANVFAALFGGSLLMMGAQAPLFGASALFLLSMALFYSWFKPTPAMKVK